MARVSMGMKTDNTPAEASEMTTARAMDEDRAAQAPRPAPCCTPAELATCCEPEAKTTCCAKTESPSKTAAACGCR